MRILSLFTRVTAVAIWSISTIAAAAVITDDVDISGNYLQFKISPDDGGIISTLRLLSGSANMAGKSGLLLEGFGVPSRYVPNRRLNEKLEALDEPKDRPVLRFSYDCEGPNIDGLHVTRIMEPLTDETSVRVTWIVENKGTERQWIAPWVGNDVMPGGAFNAEDRIDLPTPEGIIRAKNTAYHLATRNWIAATDPTVQESFFAVFHADQTHSFLTLWDEDSVDRGFQTAFIPTLLEPGKSWKTVYRLGMVRGLHKVDFATDELAVELQYTPGNLIALIASVKAMHNVHIEARILAENGRVWKLPRKKFDIDPGKVIRCTYPWDAPADGYYDFLAQLIEDGVTMPLGTDTGSPHGGIDTRFAVGKPAPREMEGWSDAPNSLDRGARTLQRTLAFSDTAQIWIESSLEKIFREDKVSPVGAPSPRARIALARDEKEAFQICLRPGDQPMINTTLQITDLTSADGTARIPAKDIVLNNVDYVPVRIPSHYEGPTGRWPDPLPPHKPFVADAHAVSTIWVTLYAAPGLPGGLYRGVWPIIAEGEAPRNLQVEVQVYDFDLPRTPRLKTDFGFWDEAALRGSKMFGGRADKAALCKAYLENALDHRVTLRDPLEFPGISGDFTGELAKRLPHIKSALADGATQIAVPADLLNAPEKLKQANDFVVKEHLQGRVFAPISHEPLEPAWPKLLEAITQWKSIAPDIPVSVSTCGLRPFLPDAVNLWCVHSQVFDTPNNMEILKRVGNNQEIWWYVNHTPPRPYANLFVDFTAMEHRILFWQAWALGMRGFQYWNINYIPEGQNPYDGLLDATPVNGDGILVYPGPTGPVNSIRWEIIRDGIEDYDYLSLFMDRRNRLIERGKQDALLERAAAVFNLEAVVPNLVTFTRDSTVLQKKRAEIAGMIEEMDKALAVSSTPQLTPVTPLESPPEIAPAPPADRPGIFPGTPKPSAPASGPNKNFGAGKKAQP